MPERFNLSDLIATYKAHPLSAQTILSRLRERGAKAHALDENDLARGDESQPTDQNHIGGAAFARRLADLAGVTAHSRVLDPCSGLGGTARVVAQSFGCHVDAVEITPQRHRDAIKLTRLVGLEPLVSHTEGDFLTVPLIEHHYDAILCQSSFVHFADKAAVVARCAQLLRPGGVLAFEDACLLRAVPPEFRRIVSALEDHWRSYLVEVAVWRSVLEAERFTIFVDEDLTEALQDHYQHCLHSPHGDCEPQTSRHASILCSEGVLGYRRICAGV